MEMKLPYGRKVEVLYNVTDELVKIKFEDGRESLYPANKLLPIEESKKEDDLKPVIIPAIDRLEELVAERNRLEKLDILLTGEEFNKFNDLVTELQIEAVKDLKNKWGLI